jgi:hypothetical protein
MIIGLEKSWHNPYEPDYCKNAFIKIIQYTVSYKHKIVSILLGIYKNKATADSECCPIIQLEANVPWHVILNEISIETPKSLSMLMDDCLYNYLVKSDSRLLGSIVIEG